MFQVAAQRSKRPSRAGCVRVCQFLKRPYFRDDIIMIGIIFVPSWNWHVEKFGRFYLGDDTCVALIGKPIEICERA